MCFRTLLRLFPAALLALLSSCVAAAAQTAAAAPARQSAELEYVVMLSRHGVRPPTTKPGAIDKFSAAPWPQWLDPSGRPVPPGYLTPHGYELMKIFGGWDRTRFSGDGLLAATGCGDAARVSIFADSDERTRETGKALAEGLFPGCAPEVHAQAEGTPDPLFRISFSAKEDQAMAAEAIAGRIGSGAQNPTETYRPQLEALDKVLAGCGKVPATNPNRASIFDIPASLTPGSYVGLRGPLASASTFAENLLLEYTDGMPEVGWGCVDEATLRYLMQIDTADWNFDFRTPTVARVAASNLLDHIEKSMEQHANGQPVAGALGKPGDRLLILVGHDTNIVTVSGMLGVDWIVDGRFDDTPPGGALLFELWRSPDGHRSVRLEYIAQTLDQMRQSQPLSAANPPVADPIFVTGCSGADMACTWDGFRSVLDSAIDPKQVVP